MKLFHETGRYIAWFARVMGVFLRIRPITTVSLVVASTVSRVTGILAFFLPIKVILLAASPEVPWYFRSFVDPDYWTEWVIFFSVAAIATYFITLGLDALSRKLAEIGSLDVLEGANDLAIIHDQRKQAHTFYDQICGIAASILFSITLLAVLPLLNREAFVAIAGMIVLSYLVSALFFGRTRPDGRPRKVSMMLDEKLAGYLGTLSSIVFFSGFVVLLYPYLQGRGGNALLSILAILLLRQLLQHLSSAVQHAVATWKRRLEINPLIFAEHQLRAAESEKDRQLRTVFSRERREALVADVLGQHGVQADELAVHWFDPVVPRVSLFDVLVKSKKGDARYQMQIFPGVGDHQLVSEDFLFDLVPRADLMAPPMLARFHHDPYEIQLCASGEPINRRQFERLLPAIRQKIWQVRPPDSLVTAFSRSRPLLSQRVDAEALERMELAVDTLDDATIYHRLQEMLPVLQRALDDIPLVIVNRDLGPRNVIELAGTDSCYVMSWGRWTLEPLGATLPNAFDRTEMSDLLETLRRDRLDIRSDLTVDHLGLAQKLWVLEQSLARAAYREALAVAGTIVANPLLTSVGSADVVEPLSG